MQLVLQLKVSEIEFSNGAQRLISPMETLARVVPVMREMKITRVADVTGLDSVGIPVVMVSRPNARSVSVSQGKGSSIAAARASGLMESVEGYHAENPVVPIRLENLAMISASESVVDPDFLPKLLGSSLRSGVSIPWVLAEELVSAGSSYVPFEMVHTNYTLPRVAGSGCFPASSNGLASGNSLLEATVHGICEVIERDAISLWHLLDGEFLDASSVDLSTVDCKFGIETLKKLEAAKLDTFLWDITSDIGVPTFFCALFDRRQEQGHIGIGSGTHLSREVALLRALHEAVQVRTTYIVGARDDITLDEYTPEGMASKREFFGGIVDRCSFSGQWDRCADLASGFLDQDLETLLGVLRRVGVDSVLRVDLTRPEFGIPVCRIIIPGLESPHDDYGYVMGPRARKLRRLAS